MNTTHTPDYGEPWELTTEFDFYINIKGELAATFESLDPAIRALACVNACQGMADPAAEIQAMRAAIEEAETSLTDIAEYWNQDENEVAMADACWHAVGTAQKAVAKLKPFIKP